MPRTEQASYRTYLHVLRGVCHCLRQPRHNLLRGAGVELDVQGATHLEGAARVVAGGADESPLQGHVAPLVPHLRQAQL